MSKRGESAENSVGSGYPASVASLVHDSLVIDMLNQFLYRTDKQDQLNDWLTHRVRPMFENRVLPLSEDVMLEWRLLVEDGRKSGHTYSQPDLMIAATALHHGLTVVSRDIRDYEKAGVSVFNPWRDAPRPARR